MRIPRYRLRFTLAAALLLTVFAVNAHAQSTGTVEGRVVDAGNGAPLPGANVLVAGTSIGTSTDEDGRYVLRDVPSGSQTIRVSFVSYEDAEKTVDVRSGQRTTLTVRLKSTITEAGEVVVTGIRKSQIRSVRRKRESINIVDVLSADDIGNLPEKNVAEAVQRLPGIVMRNDRTEGRFVAIRGSAANLNNVTLNGNTLASTAGSRATALDLLPAEMVSNIEVTKAVRPDQAGNAIGGSVDINTLSALDRNEAFAFGSFRGLNHDQQVDGLRDTNTPFRANVTTGTQLGSNDDFGVVVSGSASRRDFTTSALEGEDWEEAEERGPAEVLIPEAQQQVVETHRRRRFAVNSSLDWRPTSQTSVFVRPYWTYTDEESLDNELEFNFLGEETVTERGRVRFSEGFAELDLSNSTEEETLWGTNVGFEHQFDSGVSWSASGTFTRGTLDETKPDGEFNTPETEQSSSVADMSDFLFQAFPEDPSFVGNADNFTQNNIDIEFFENEEDTWSAKTDLRIPFEIGDRAGFLKTGGKLLLRDKSVNAAELEFIADPDQAPTLQRFLAPSVRTVQVGNRLFPFADTDAFVEWFMNEGCSPATDTPFSGDRSCQIDGPFEINEEEVAMEDIENDSDNEEDIYAGYIMGSTQIGRLTVLAGARVERTSTDTRRFQLLEDDETGEISTTTQDFSTSYTDVLPSVHLTYAVRENVQLRAAWTNTIGRPDFEELSAFREVDVSPPLPDGRFEASVEEGNPNLEPFEATAFDLGAEYFFGNGGLASLAGFYKEIDNPIFSFSRTERDVQDAFGQGRNFRRINFEQEQNADQGTILGLEMTYQQPFTFLPSPFDGFGISSNVTITDSDVDVPQRDGDLPFFEQADLTYNVVPYFQKQGFEFRVALNHQGAFLEDLDDTPIEDDFRNSRTTVDLNAAYELAGVLGKPELLLQIENATNAPEVFTSGRGGENLSSHLLSGRTISVGFKAEF